MAAQTPKNHLAALYTDFKAKFNIASKNNASENQKVVAREAYNVYMKAYPGMPRRVLNYVALAKIGVSPSSTSSVPQGGMRRRHRKTHKRRHSRKGTRRHHRRN